MAVNRYQRIHIIGGPGSGKSYLGKKLAKHLSVPLQDLDNIFWDKNAATKGVKMSSEVRNKNLEIFLENTSWVVEGIYYKWLDQSFENADVIIFICPSNFIRNYRIIKRYIQGKLGFIDSKKETFKSLIALIKWGQGYSRETLPLILEVTQKYEAKRFIFINADEAFESLFATNKK